MAYKIKTEDEWEIQELYPGGWEVVTTESSYKEYKENLKTYRENSRNPIRGIKRRVKIETI
jgi:hypothetical protein